jgi:hypothetical protein
MSDSELAAVTERLLAESAPFPTDLLLPPAPAAPQQRLPQPQFLPSLKAEEKEEDLDDTAALLRALGEAAGETAAGAAADGAGNTVLDKLPPVPDIASWAALAPKIGRTIGFGAAAAAAVPALAALARRRGEKKQEEAQTQPMDALKVAGGWLGWFLREQEEPPAAAALDADKPVEQAARAQATPPPPPVTQTPPQTNGHVLWKRKEGEGGAAAGTSESGQVLWRRKDGAVEAPAGAGQREQDLWRVPIESLRGGEEAAPAEAPTSRPAPAPGAPRSGPRVLRVSEAALDNAEPPDFAANGSR